VVGVTAPEFRARPLAFLDHLDGEKGSLIRARDGEVSVVPLDQPGHLLVAFADSEHVHDLLLRRDGDEWKGDCWAVADGTGEPIRRCRGLEYDDGPCAHLFAAWSDDGEGWSAPDVGERRADHHVEELLADGGRQRWFR
jgi:hypothetical protein